MKKENKNQDEENFEFEFKHDHKKDQPNKNKIIVAQQIIKNLQSNLDQLASLLGANNTEDFRKLVVDLDSLDKEEAGRIIEGVFDGQNMIGPDGKQYTVPSNYASKSKLVEGDILKLTISRSGSFIYKQIGPIERTRLIGTLAIDEETKEFYVVANNKSYRVLPASITYYKGEVGDEVVILVPKNSDSNWAAVENIIKKAPG